MFSKVTVENGISIKRIGQSLHVKRFNDDHGFQYYRLTNTGDDKNIIIPYYLLGRFRMVVDVLIKQYSGGSVLDTAESLTFLGKKYFEFGLNPNDNQELEIIDLDALEGSSGLLRVKVKYLGLLGQLLYDSRLGHPNDVLQKIISYHKLFQFSFVHTSKSMSSGLTMRKDVLQKVKDYTPKNFSVSSPKDKKPLSHEKIEEITPPDIGPGDSQFNSKLGERTDEKNITVDYESVFGARPKSDATPDLINVSGRVKRLDDTSFVIPIDCRDLKSFSSNTYVFELSADSAKEFRDVFFTNRESSYFLGFEIVDALFKSRNMVKTCQFPLYYMAVTIRESGRKITVSANENGLFYLNHLALSNIVEKFSNEKGEKDSIDKFFETLLSQDIIVDNKNDRIHLSRLLPIKESIFDRTREILFGYVEENGKGGILDFLSIDGFECDLQTVALYRIDNATNPIEQALDIDLERIDEIAHQQPERFYQSLLGKFLTPEKQINDKSHIFSSIVWMPGYMPGSSKRLIQALNEKDMVLLEGPPGTGKTHTIMNLFIHSVCSGKKIMVVSDQAAATEALVEKLSEYVEGDGCDYGQLLKGAVKIVHDFGDYEGGLKAIIKCVENALKPGTFDSLEMLPINLEKELLLIEQEVANAKEKIAKLMSSLYGEDAGLYNSLLFDSRKNESLIGLLKWIEVLQKEDVLTEEIKLFVEQRKLIKVKLRNKIYDYFKVDHKDILAESDFLEQDKKILNRLKNKKPKNMKEFESCVDKSDMHEIISYLYGLMKEKTRSHNVWQRLFKRLVFSVSSPLKNEIDLALSVIENNVKLFARRNDIDDELWHVLNSVHCVIGEGDKNNAALMFYQTITNALPAKLDFEQIQQYLDELERVIGKKTDIVLQKFKQNLFSVVSGANKSMKQSGTSEGTTLESLIDNLKQYSSIKNSANAWDEMRKKLFELFPFWIVRKQVVPLLLPCEEKMFDLIVVDEATQCRVDDSLSLLFRAEKLLVVGDEKQTVLSKNSPIDDYLFKDHDLDEHLRSTQARGFKGGGSNIFALVHSIKQSSVMLDEHYRCPSDIIDYSNQFVYNNALKIMQWSLPGQPSSVVVDNSERSQSSSKKVSSGKFKGIETEMIDRFFGFMEREIKRIEAETGDKISLEKDIAICYFLLKNEPYVKFAKEKFISKMNRGRSLLDGAGAALQGKERDYIFYLWDITRYNMAVFKQGDDKEKRKGELNVLMSRPKKRAFHYLHKSFEQLDHSKASITQYLLNKVESQDIKSDSDDEGKSIHLEIIQQTIRQTNNRRIAEKLYLLEGDNVAVSRHIIVGDPAKNVDLLLSLKGGKKLPLAIVDVSNIIRQSDPCEEMVDYYFQLLRSIPKMRPLFVLPYELLDENGNFYRRLLYHIEQ